LRTRKRTITHLIIMVVAENTMVVVIKDIEEVDTDVSTVVEEATVEVPQPMRVARIASRTDTSRLRQGEATATAEVVSEVEDTTTTEVGTTVETSAK